MNDVGIDFIEMAVAMGVAMEAESSRLAMVPVPSAVEFLEQAARELPDEQWKRVTSA